MSVVIVVAGLVGLFFALCVYWVSHEVKTYE